MSYFYFRVYLNTDLLIKETTHKPVNTEHCMMALLLCAGRSSNFSFLQMALQITLRVTRGTLMMITKNGHVAQIHNYRSTCHSFNKIS